MKVCHPGSEKGRSWKEVQVILAEGNVYPEVTVPPLKTEFCSISLNDSEANGPLSSRMNDLRESRHGLNSLQNDLSCKCEESFAQAIDDALKNDCFMCSTKDQTGGIRSVLNKETPIVYHETVSLNYHMDARFQKLMN